MTVGPGGSAMLKSRAVLAGFPCTDPKPPGPFELGGWTILLPTRRAVRELEDIFFRLKGSSGVLLPRIRPIGDIDEDLLAPDQGADDLGTPVTAPGQLLLLMELIDEWARAHPATRLAQEIASAPQQVGGLASSLAEFLDAIETEDIDLAKLPELYGLEIRAPPRGHSRVPRHRAGEISPAPDDREGDRPAGTALRHPAARGETARIHPHGEALHRGGLHGLDPRHLHAAEGHRRPSQRCRRSPRPRPGDGRGELDGGGPHPSAACAEAAARRASMPCASR